MHSPHLQRRLGYPRSLAGAAAAAACWLCLGSAGAVTPPLAGPDNPPPDKNAPHPATPRAAAQFDMTGNWVSIVSMDWVYRMTVPPKGDAGSVPVNDAGQKATDAWDAAQDVKNGATCKAYGAGGLIRRPGRIHISWADDRTLRLEFDAGMQTRLLHFSDKIAPIGYLTSEPPVTFALPPDMGPPSLQGYSVAAWHKQGQSRGMSSREQQLKVLGGGSLAVITGNLLPGYLQTNGVPYGADTFMKEFFDMVTLPSGEQLLVVTSIVEDPQYLRLPFVVSTPFKREPDASKWDPNPC
jgi:hypothetical protein